MLILRWRCAERGGIIGVELAVLPASGAPPAAAENAKEYEASNAGCETNDKGFVVVDPARDFFARGGAGTLSLL